MRGDLCPFPAYLSPNLGNFFKKVLASPLKERVTTIESLKNQEWYQEFDFARGLAGGGKNSHRSPNELNDLYEKSQQDQISENSEGSEDLSPQALEREQADTEDSHAGLINIKSVREFSDGRIMGLATEHGIYSPTKEQLKKPSPGDSSERGGLQGSDFLPADGRKSQTNLGMSGPYQTGPRASVKSRTKIDLDEGLLDNLHGRTHIAAFNV